MNKKLWSVFAGLCGLMMLTLCSIPSGAQTPEANKKPPMYTYVAAWQIPRPNWADMEKANSASKAIVEKALADGTIVGYGDDEVQVHVPDGETHDNWWSAMSLAGLMKVLDQFAASGNTAPSVLSTATGHWDNIFVSRYYNWHSGSYKGGYTLVATYKMRPDAPPGALDTLSQNMVVPLLDKLIADGTIVEYEIDTQAIHTQEPGTFWIAYVTPQAEGLDKVQAAIRDTLSTHPLSGPAFDSMTDYGGHRDELVQGDGTYK